MMDISPRAKELPLSQIRTIAAMAEGIHHAAKLYFGESDKGTPDFIKEAAWRAMEKNYTFYTHNAGFRELREAIAAKVKELRGISYDPDSEIAVTAGGVMGLFLSIYTVLNPGDKAIIVTPLWPNSHAITKMVGAEPVEVPLKEEGDRYRLDVDAVARAVDDRTRLLILSNPSNPTGWLGNKEELRELCKLAERHDLHILSDEVYDRIVYEGEIAESLSQFDRGKERVIVVNSFSKTYCMTGWRLGYVLAGKSVISQVSKLQEYTVSCASSIAQRAGIVALNEGERFIKEMREEYRKKRDMAFFELSKIDGLELNEPQGAFYIFPGVPGLNDSFSFAKKLLAEKGVGVAPGSAFGEAGEGRIRLCFAMDEEVFRSAVDKLRTFIERGDWKR